ncbi:MAG: hypothetical protein R8J41_00350 [Alphaproteobacteria bacterium]|nr:hypothetical protein [Alphaproteobacteria bacterium]
MPNTFFKQRRQYAQDSFPIRLTFDAPQWELHDMVKEADFYGGSNVGGRDRVHFYFSDVQRLTVFTQRFGWGREMTDLERDTFKVGRRGGQRSFHRGPSNAIPCLRKNEKADQ